MDLPIGWIWWEQMQPLGWRIWAEWSRSSNRLDLLGVNATLGEGSEMELTPTNLPDFIIS